MFFSKPAGGPDVHGGLFPIDFPAVRCINRSGAALTRGEVAQLALTPGEASEIATNDSNSYKPGYSNDTVWNTVIDPISNTATGSSIQRGALFGVCMSDTVSDNKVGEFKFFGIIEKAFCVSSGTLQAGDPLTVSTTNSFANPVPLSNSFVAVYLDIQDASITAREQKRVFLHNGFFPSSRITTALS